MADLVKILKHRNVFAKGYTPNWEEELFMIRNVKNTVPWTYVITDKKIVEAFIKKELKKVNQTKFRVEKVIKRKKVINYTSNRKVMINLLIVRLVKTKQGNLSGRSMALE